MTPNHILVKDGRKDLHLLLAELGWNMETFKWNMETPCEKRGHLLSHIQSNRRNRIYAVVGKKIFLGKF